MIVTIREATVADAHEIAEVHVEGWRWGYRGLLPDEVIEAWTVARREEAWTAAFTDAWHHGNACFVAVLGAAVVGFVACGAAAEEHEAPPPAAGEVYAIYLRADAAGAGVGRALFAEAVVALRASGFERAVLWVLEDNERSRRFYEAAGWAWDGTRSAYRFDGCDRPILRYAVEL